MPKIGIILSGCGVKDGSEIHEATLLLLAIDKAGATALCFAPDKDQADVVDHVTGKAAREKRNVLVESARIARGEIRDLREAKTDELDAVILPGGFGAAKNLCSFAEEGAQCQVDPEVARVLRGMRQAGKPIGAACIAPVLLARLFGSDKPVLTIGSDPGTARAVESMGARHEVALVTGVSVDPALRLATTPCYMLATRISQIAEGMENLVKAVLELASATAKR
ncbi:MAG: isoprenoid biosynthesis glyoxalase ElbB [Elusimicrobia bacterium]|nr:isoprenoid biosynthesis glyoxalase ElbB [Elusimicrobiota bacterium]